MVETEQREASESSQELDVGLQLGDTGQVTEYHLDDKKVEERIEEEEEKEKKIPKSEEVEMALEARGDLVYTTGLAPLWSWSWSWMRRWSAPRGTRPGVTTQEGQWEESLIPWPDKDLEGADRDSRTQTEGLDTKA